VLSSAPGMRASSPTNLALFTRRSTLPMVYEFGGGGADRTDIICCFLGCDERPYNPLLAALPHTIHVSSSGAETTAGLLRTLVTLALRETAAMRAGGENVLARVSELLFVETIRWYLEALPTAETGWLAGVRDADVGRAIAAMHAEPAHPWTVETLARHVGLSRSILAERFTSLVSQPPMQYLALWRMQLASRRLLDGDQVNDVAAAVGYESEAAFSRAFKKLVGTSPGAWKKSAGLQSGRKEHEGV